MRILAAGPMFPLFATLPGSIIGNDVMPAVTVAFVAMVACALAALRSGPKSRVVR
jgi:hypothetical protein